MLDSWWWRTLLATAISTPASSRCSRRKGPSSASIAALLDEASASARCFAARVHSCSRFTNCACSVSSNIGTSAPHLQHYADRSRPLRAWHCARPREITNRPLLNPVQHRGKEAAAQPCTPRFVPVVGVDAVEF